VQLLVAFGAFGAAAAEHVGAHEHPRVAGASDGLLADAAGGAAAAAQLGNRACNL